MQYSQKTTIEENGKMAKSVLCSEWSSVNATLGRDRVKRGSHFCGENETISEGAKELFPFWMAERGILYDNKNSSKMSFESPIEENTFVRLKMIS